MASRFAPLRNRAVHRACRLAGIATVSAIGAACIAPRPAVAPASGAAESALARAQGHAARVEAARGRQEATLARLFSAAHVSRPAPLLVIAYKQERSLELWGYSRSRGRYALVARYPILAESGRLGPKRRAWDGQIPEGFYHIDLFNPASQYHLSMRVDYPNRADIILGERSDPGNDIYIHGDAVSIGCIPIGDRAIEQLYLAALGSRVAGYGVPVAIFPCRFSSTACRSLLSRASRGRPGLAAFWANLAEGYAVFTRTGAPPKVKVESSGRYAFEPVSNAATATGRVRAARTAA